VIIFSTAQDTSFYPRDAMLARVLAMALSVCHKSVFCWSGWMHRAGFWHGGFFRPVLHCVLSTYGSNAQVRIVISKANTAIQVTIFQDQQFPYRSDLFPFVFTPIQTISHASVVRAVLLWGTMEFNSLNHPQFSLWHTFSIIKARTSYILKGERSVVCENRNSEVSVLFIDQKAATATTLKSCILYIISSP